MCDKVRTLLINISLIFFGTLVSVLLLEVGVRFFHPSLPAMPGSEMEWFRNSEEAAQTHRIDAELGFIPVLGGPEYNEYGTLKNTYQIEKSSGKKRILLIYQLNYH